MNNNNDAISLGIHESSIISDDNEHKIHQSCSNESAELDPSSSVRDRSEKLEGFYDSLGDVIQTKKCFINVFFILVGIGGALGIGYIFSQYNEMKPISMNNEIEMEQGTLDSSSSLSEDENESQSEDFNIFQEVVESTTESPSSFPSPIVSSTPSIFSSNAPSEVGTLSSMPSYMSEVTLWDDSNPIWIHPDYHLAQWNASSNILTTLVEPDQTNPESPPNITEGDHFVEVAFKVNAMEPKQAWKNPIFSQHGDWSGWEIRASDHVDFLWTTESRFSLEHNEFQNKKIKITIGEWYHVVGTYRWGQTKLTLYVNGIPQTKYVFGRFVPETSQKAVLGRNLKWKDRYFDGFIAFADVRTSFPVDARDMDDYVMNLSKKRLQILNSIQ